MKSDVPPMSLSTRLRCAVVVVHYCVFAIGGACISLLILPVSLLCSRKVVRWWGSFLLHYGWKSLCILMRLTRSMNLHIEEAKKLRNLRGCIIVANHPSLIDVVILLSIIPKTNAVVKAALRRWFFLRPILRSICLVNDRDIATLKREAQEVLDNGYNVLIFPEGTRTSPGSTRPLHRGAAYLALECNVPIQPVRIDLSHPLLTKELPWWYAGKGCPAFRLTPRNEFRPGEYRNMSTPMATRLLTRDIAKELDLIGDRA